MAPLLVIEANGSAAAIGETIGRALRPVVQEAVARHRRFLETFGVRWEHALDIARRCRADLEDTLPRTAAELHAMADAAAVDVDALVSLNALQETLFLARRLPPAEGCTSLALPAATTADRSVLLAHNEDALASRHEQVYVVRCRPADEPAFVAFAYSGLFLYQGVNEVGIGSTGNALHVNDIRIGVPKLFLYREVLRASSLADAIRTTLLPERANGNNHLIATADGEIYDSEVTGRHAALHYIGNAPFAHTNHVLATELRKLEEGDTLDSQLRRNRAQRLLDLGHGQHTVESLRAILADHANAPNAICKHLDPNSADASRTIAALLVDVSARALWIAPGTPCRAPFERVALA